ncbi:hypothetical protein GWK47_053652 [Chionoecetes opilio]|uniref:Uncharacterized protein n=1 Tax=Chionoecetes opilio TaxID=41210 RepID=A0A8J5C8Z5_CHIOP|nr:hypothetical protein GWK47_053652 [Chionoecetes opilio]
MARDALSSFSCGSRFLADARGPGMPPLNSSCSPPPGPMLKCRPYLIGLQSFTFMTDHQTPDPHSQPLHLWTRLRTLASNASRRRRGAGPIWPEKLWFLQSTAAATLLGCTTAPRCRSHEGPGTADCLLARYRCRKITSTVQACEPCQILQPSQQQEPLLCDDHPSRPFESISQTFLRHREVVPGHSRTDSPGGLWSLPAGRYYRHAHHMLFCRDFRDVGFPLRLRTDGGPQSPALSFPNFTERWGVYHAVFFARITPSLKATPRRPSSR